MLNTLRKDMSRLPELLAGRPAPAAPQSAMAAVPASAPEPEFAQLGLF